MNFSVVVKLYPILAVKEIKTNIFTDSDYQLGSAAQTPGLNNSVVSVSGTSGVSSPSSPPSVTPLAEAYMARNRNFTTAIVSIFIFFSIISP